MIGFPRIVLPSSTARTWTVFQRTTQRGFNVREKPPLPPFSHFFLRLLLRTRSRVAQKNRAVISDAFLSFTLLPPRQVKCAASCAPFPPRDSPPSPAPRPEDAPPLSNAGAFRVLLGLPRLDGQKQLFPCSPFSLRVIVVSA